MPRKIDPSKPYFNIGAVAEILGVKPRMLRVYEDRGLITPSRTEGNRRLYSLNDIDVLAYVQYLTSVKKVNLDGVAEIQRILGRLDPAVRETFMKEIEEEIGGLTQEQKKAFRGEEEEVASFILTQAENFTPASPAVDVKRNRRKPA